MNNIKKIYQHACKCEDQKNLKDILDAAMVLTPEEVIDESPHVRMISTQIKKTSASKSLCLFTNILNVKKKTAKLRVGDAKSKRTAFKRREYFQDVICRRDYSERVVASFTRQIQSEYYGVN